MKARLLFPISFAILAAIMALPGNGLASGAKQPPVVFSTDLSGGDLQFLTSAAEQGLLQATLGVLAADHAKSSEVRDYGQTLATHHATQNEQIKLLAIKKGVAIASRLTPRQNTVAEKLSKLDGLKFDKAYLEEVIQDQQAYAAVFEKAAQSDDPDIKSFVMKSLPEIRHNLELLKKMTGFAPTGEASPHFRTDTAPTPAPSPDGSLHFRGSTPDPNKN